MIVSSFFQFCPRCGVPRGSASAPGPFRCQACGFVFFFNPPGAAAVFIAGVDGRVLFLRRAHEPAQGKLGLPGGFIDFDETAEAAVRREVREEVGIELGNLSYVGSETNRYLYLEVTYQVLDFFFQAEISPDAKPLALDGVQSLEWLNPADIAPEEIAFVSVRAGLKVYLQRRAGR